MAMVMELEVMAMAMTMAMEVMAMVPEALEAVMEM